MKNFGLVLQHRYFHRSRSSRRLILKFNRQLAEITSNFGKSSNYISV